MTAEWETRLDKITATYGVDARFDAAKFGDRLLEHCQLLVDAHLREAEDHIAEMQIGRLRRALRDIAGVTDE